MTRRALLALLAVGCTTASEQAAPPPARAADACLSAAREVAAGIAASPLGPLPPAAHTLACPELYRRAPCAEAWVALYGEAAPDPAARVDRVLVACGAAYCGELPAGVRACGPEQPAGHDDRVDRLIELDRAVLVAEKLDAVTADKLSLRSVLLREVTAKAPARADAGAPP